MYRLYPLTNASYLDRYITIMRISGFTKVPMLIGTKAGWANGACGSPVLRPVPQANANACKPLDLERFSYVHLTA
jgi:hypothetical protein